MEDPVVDAILNQYFRRLEQALAGSPAERRAQIVEDLRAHVEDACRRSPIARMRRSWQCWIASVIPMRSRGRRSQTSDARLSRCGATADSAPTNSAASACGRWRLSSSRARLWLLPLSW